MPSPVGETAKYRIVQQVTVTASIHEQPSRRIQETQFAVSVCFDAIRLNTAIPIVKKKRPAHDHQIAGHAAAVDKSAH